MEINPNPDEVWPIFVGVWIVLGAASFVIFFLGEDAQLKRKLWPPFVIGSGILFLLFGYILGFRGEALYFMVPAVAVITGINLKSTKFCDSCGKTAFTQSLFSAPKFCAKCGAKFD